jgi:hypothetical protein
LIQKLANVVIQMLNHHPRKQGSEYQPQCCQKKKNYFILKLLSLKHIKWAHNKSKYLSNCVGNVEPLEALFTFQRS